jgi:hypothetical protein
MTSMIDAAIDAVPAAFAAGSLTILVFSVGLVIASAYALYTRKGGGISMNPYRRDVGPPESPDSLTHDTTQVGIDGGILSGKARGGGPRKV